MTYELECDMGQAVGTLKHIEETSMCEYTITFASQHACPVGEP